MPTGFLSFERSNITADGIQSGALQYITFYLTWDSWVCANLSIADTLVLDADDTLNAFGIYNRQRNIFNDRSILFCNESVLTLRLNRDSGYDSYLKDTFYLTFVNATLRRKSPVPTRATFVVVPAPVPNDVSAAVLAAQASSNAALLGGVAASSNQALAIMGLSQCARPTMQVATANAVQSMVPFPLDATYQGWLFGNFLLLGFVSVLHFPLVVIIKEAMRTTWYEARELGLFPSLSFTFIQMFHAGIAYSSINLIIQGDSSSDVAVGWFGMVYIWAMPVAMWVWSQKYLETKFLYFGFFNRITNPVAKFVTPQGFFTPEQFSGALGNLREATKTHMIVPYIEVNGVCLIGAIRASTEGGCIALYTCLGLWHLSFALYYLVLRPNRSGFLNALAAIMDFEIAAIGFGCAYWAHNRDFGLQVVTKLLLVQNITGSAASVVTIGLSLVEKFFWRPRELKEQASTAVLNALSKPLLEEGGDAAAKLGSDQGRSFATVIGGADVGFNAKDIAPDLDLLIEAATGRPAPPQDIPLDKIEWTRPGDHLDATNGGALDPFALFDNGFLGGAAGELQDGGVTQRRTVDDGLHIEASVSYGRKIAPQPPSLEEDAELMDLLAEMDRKQREADAKNSKERLYTKEERFLLSIPDPKGLLHPWDVDPADVAAAARERLEKQRREADERRRRELFGDEAKSNWLDEYDGFFTTHNSNWGDEAMSILGIVTPAVPLQDMALTQRLNEGEREELQRLATWEPKSVREALEKFDAVERLQNPWASASPMRDGDASSQSPHASHHASAHASEVNAASDRRHRRGGDYDSVLAPAPPATAVEAAQSLTSFLSAVNAVDPTTLTPDAIAKMTDEELLGPVLSQPRTARQRVEAALRREQVRENFFASRRVARGEASINAILDRPISVRVVRNDELAPSPSRSAAVEPGSELWDVL